MKDSEIIQAALDNHYATKKGQWEKREFMCHAIEDVVYNDARSMFSVEASKVVDRVTDYFMPMLLTHHRRCLTNYFRGIDKKYNSLAERFGNFSPFCVKTRVQFWENLIAELKEKGL